MGEQRRRILAVDDEKNVVRLIQIHLEKLGYDVMGATDGEAALSLIAENPPDLVVLDINMPKMNGFEVLRRLKAEPKTACVPVIIVTARRQPADIAHGYTAGARWYLNKPFQIAELGQLVRRVLDECRPYAQVPGAP
jgi:DNA-binding response OmpR family regulator